MAFQVKQRERLAYSCEGERPVLAALVTEVQPDGDIKIYFAGLTGGYSARGGLGRDEHVTMDPHREIPLVFACWETWLRAAYEEVYAGWIAEYLPDHGLPCRVRVHQVDVPDQGAFYEFYGAALLQRAARADAREHTTA
jgi:hypothetical protein